MGSSQVYVLDRSTNGSVSALSRDGQVRWQSALDDCGAHDFVELSSQWGLVTCYDDAALRLVSLADGEVSLGPSLVEQADADGLPEADRLYVGQEGYVWVSVQRLARGDGYRPVGYGRVLRSRVTLIDQQVPEFGSWEMLEVEGLKNPITQFTLNGDSVTLGFAGDWQSDASEAGRAFLGTEPFELTRIEISSPRRVWQIAGDWWLGSLSSAESLEVRTMSLFSDGGTTASALWMVDGFSLGGMVETPEGGVLVAYRPPDGAPAILRFGPDGSQDSQLAWSLKPWELVLVP